MSTLKEILVTHNLDEQSLIIGRTLEYLKLEEMPWVIRGIDLSQGSRGLFMGLN